MKLAIDLDGVVYDWQRTYRYMLRVYRGIALPPVADFWFHWNAPDAYTSPEDRKWMWSEGVRLGLFRYGHVETGAIVSLHRLAQAGHELVVVTHRPKQAVNDTLDFCSYLAGDLWKWSGILILTEQESKTVASADILIDDKDQNVIEWAKSGRIAVLFDQPWNRQMELRPKIIRAGGWPAVVDIVESLAEVLA